MTATAFPSAPGLVRRHNMTKKGRSGERRGGGPNRKFTAALFPLPTPAEWAVGLFFVAAMVAAITCLGG